FIQVNTDNGKARLHFGQLGYITTAEMDSRDKIAHLKDNSTIYLKNISFDKLLDLLPANRFCRINKKDVISLDIIKVFTFDEITTNLISRDGKPIVFNLGEIYRNPFLNQVRI